MLKMFYITRFIIIMLINIIFKYMIPKAKQPNSMQRFINFFYLVIYDLLRYFFFSIQKRLHVNATALKYATFD